MTFLESVFFGIIQGFTEFLPVSSSGHLVLLQHFLNIQGPMVSFFVLVHLGTLIAVFFYFREEFWLMLKEGILFLAGLARGNSWKEAEQQFPQFRLILLILVASVPVAVIGLLFKDWVKAFFGSISAVGIAWISIGFLLVASRWFQLGNKKLSELSYWVAFLIGFVQCIALVPGISRSGITILMGMMLGVDKEHAARFSFFIAVPAILGATLLEWGEGMEFIVSYPYAALGGFFTAMLTGFLAIVILFRLIHQKRFFVFGFYCLGIGVLTILRNVL